MLKLTANLAVHDSNTEPRWGEALKWEDQSREFWEDQFKEFEGWHHRDWNKEPQSPIILAVWKDLEEKLPRATEEVSAPQGETGSQSDSDIDRILSTPWKKTGEIGMEENDQPCDPTGGSCTKLITLRLSLEDKENGFNWEKDRTIRATEYEVPSDRQELRVDLREAIIEGVKMSLGTAIAVPLAWGISKSLTLSKQ